MSGVDERVAYLAHERSSRIEDRVTAYLSPGDVPGDYVVRYPLRRLLSDLRHPHPPLCRWWRLDDVTQLAPDHVEILDITEEDDWIRRPKTIRGREYFLRFGHEWIHLAQDRDTGAVFTYSTDGWLKVFCEGPMPDGWVPDGAGESPS